MILFENAYVIDPATGTEGMRDVLIDGDRVEDVGQPGELKAASVKDKVDVNGKWLVPGLVDLHVHLREPGYEWKETIAAGAKAAVAGGFTTICSMPNTNPVNDNAEVTKFILEKAAAAGYARVLPVGAVTIGLKGEAMAPYSELEHAGCVAFSDDGNPVENPLLLRRALEWCSMTGRPVALHEEDRTLSEHGSMNESALSSRLGYAGITGASDDVMIARDIEIARLTKGRMHFCHLSTARSVELVKRAKNDGIAVTAEVTPHHLMLTEDAVLMYDTNAKMNPPLRLDEDMMALRAGLADGTIDCVATDHAPHELDKKRIEFALAAFGIIGLQTALPLILELVRNGTLTRMRAVEAMTVGAARAFGLPDASIKPGSSADLVIIDPEESWEFSEGNNFSLSANSPFSGKKMKGRAITAVIGGRFVLRERVFQNGAV